MLRLDIDQMSLNDLIAADQHLIDALIRRINCLEGLPAEFSREDWGDYQTSLLRLARMKAHEFECDPIELVMPIRAILDAAPLRTTGEFRVSCLGSHGTLSHAMALAMTKRDISVAFEPNDTAIIQSVIENRSEAGVLSCGSSSGEDIDAGTLDLLCEAHQHNVRIRKMGSLLVELAL